MDVGSYRRKKKGKACGSFFKRVRIKWGPGKEKHFLIKINK